MNYIEGVREDLSSFTNKIIQIDGKGLQQITRDAKHRAHRVRLYNLRESLRTHFIDNHTFMVKR